jgi:hypothetical protein
MRKRKKREKNVKFKIKTDLLLCARLAGCDFLDKVLKVIESCNATR